VKTTEFLAQQQQETIRTLEQPSLVGLSIQRVDTVAKVTGRALFVKDMRLPRQLFARIKRCPYPHARIISIDISQASEIPGVKAIISAKDFPPPSNEDTPPLAYKEVLYSNQSVVAVAADSLIFAERAIEAIDVEYEELSAVFDPELAMSDRSPVMITHPNENASGNVARHIVVKQGDTEGAFRRSDYVVENTYSTGIDSHFQLEPLSFLANPDYDGGLTIWATTSGPHKGQYELARYLGIDPYKIRVKTSFLGGWFGSKEESHVAAICAKLALKSQRPVKLELTREETITATGVRHPSKIHIKDGVNRDGEIVARQVRAIYAGGAFSAVANHSLRNSLYSVALYKIPNFQMDVYRVYTNRVPGTPKRGPIITQLTWAIECQMDNLASKLGMDPLELRLKNILHNGDENALGEKMRSISHDKCLSEVARSIEWRRRKQAAGPWRFGKGIAIAAKGGPTGDPHEAMIRVRSTGKVEVWADLVENGQGIYTTILQIVATEFGIPAEDVVVMPLAYGSDSIMFGLSGGASASRQLVKLGKAVILACRDAKARIAEQASEKLSVRPSEIDVSAGKAFLRNDQGRSVTLASLFSQATIVGRLKAPFVEGRDFIGYGLYYEEPGKFDPETGRLVSGVHSPYYSNSAQAVEVAVNVETGHVMVLTVATAMDVGKAIHPEIVRGQMTGSVAMALSAALSEELEFAEGRISNANLADYKILTAVDTPEIRPIIVETEYVGGPYGAKNAGEVGSLPTAPAIRNALHDAVGIWINDMPITPERVMDALDDEMKEKDEEVLA
jgi:CO/xanthine dehydrogenase Mo-binding subunit